MLLDNNLIGDLGSFTFANLVNLIVLDLKSNKISKIKKSALQGLVRLEVLDLSKNKLQEIRASLFAGLFGLKLILLQFNRILTIEPQTFVDQSHLELLVLEMNSISHFSDGFLQGMKLTSLFMDNNQFEAIVSSTMCTVLLQRLFFQQNRLKELSEFTFLNMSNLLYLDLRNNVVTFVADKFYWFSAASPGKHVAKLETMLFDDNKLTNLNFLSSAFLSSLRTLTLSFNWISSVKSAHFKSLTSLRTLDLSNNQIKSIETGSFAK
jgi:Leucine-rich repeat (LRR) protein